MQLKSYFFILILFTSVVSYSQTSKEFNIDKNNVAVGGYDVISYTEGKAEEGTKKYISSFQGVDYYFTSKEHVDKFLLEPEKYTPAYGGWCAYAMADKGEKVDVNYETFVIQNGRLMLFYNKFFSNTFEDWKEEGPDKLEKIADKNWSKIIH
ncbi:YHS domain-containing (seleno)protein [Flammeovirga kamogawensis]|uniref:YHS domain protein n=1 Tax=Flammeovirga kamogawensis TaxID=373891 RepID=A0ABX8GT39_9BACT|nr:YHS domain-containing (seleno)protein [Flammeovirga kamogawensis]MBB6464067.1 YHS domain-containing protein [Flammeovirga kamogawensis]QWG06561.1 YHS domain protein [Flammeovirga kamogawensis]TRX68388.1 hypothetical protein EO216_09715 [Flammeovirga kamogawensis]